MIARTLPKNSANLTPGSLDDLRSFLDRHQRSVVLTGAGISVASGIPTYRDHRGAWQRSDPIQHQQFMSQHYFRQRYWARSLIGWPAVRQAIPNVAHHALARFEEQGRLALLVTQNVDGLHQAAGSKNICDLHGRIDRVVCTDCGTLLRRHDVQTWLEKENQGLLSEQLEIRPDGDADFDGDAIHDVCVPECPQCGGILKPDVVFFGDNVPKTRVAVVAQALEAADALWVVGSSLMVYSGFRFVRQAKALGKPVCILNLGQTRADDLADIKVSHDCSDALSAVLGDAIKPTKA